MGTILVAFFASSALGGSETNFDSMSQLKVQVIAVVATVIYTAIVSYIILKLIDVISGLRVSDEVEANGLDLGDHGEVGYDS